MCAVAVAAARETTGIDLAAVDLADRQSIGQPPVAAEPGSTGLVKVTV